MKQGASWYMSSGDRNLEIPSPPFFFFIIFFIHNFIRLQFLQVIFKRDLDAYNDEMKVSKSLSRRTSSTKELEVKISTHRLTEGAFSKTFLVSAELQEEKIAACRI
uniref:Uncharacterized protein n=1 Tax=Candidozyma auris TaxID=498019 RepID=A0A0L0NSF3_CANAR